MKIPLPYHLAYPSEAVARGINAPAVSSFKMKTRRVSSSPRGSFRALAIIVEFSDKPAQTSSVLYDSVLFGTTRHSLRTYYDEVSYGTLDIVTVNFPSSVGWVTAAQPYSYYVNGQYGFGAYPRNAQKLAEDAIAAVDSLVDFSRYDNDGDGYVDALYIIHAGSGGEFSGSPNDIWSHTWTTSSPILVDGVHAFVFSVEPEYWRTPGDMTCGVFAHESGHVLFDLPDLYDLDGDSHGLGRWSVMASGSWNGSLGDTPAHPDAWSRSKMRFVTPVSVEGAILRASIPAVEESAKVYRLWKQGTIGNEYFLVENRQRSGFDSQLRGDGLCIYHVDEVRAGNNSQWYPGFEQAGHYKVALEQADGLWELERRLSSGDAGDPYPGSRNRLSFTSLTTPASSDYHGVSSFVSVTEISSSGRIMTANLLVDSIGILQSNRSNVAFNGVMVGVTKSETLRVVNKGIAPANILSASSTNTLFAVTPSIATISPLDSVTFVISFSPTSLGSYAGTLLLSSDSSPDTVALNGTAVRRTKRLPIKGALLETTTQDSLMQAVIGSTLDERESNPEGFILYKNYPDPFNPVTRIQYSMPERSRVSLKVYDAIGREVMTLVEGIQDGGMNVVEFNGSGLPSGVYFYRLVTDKFSAVRKMLYVR
ncbi:MAG: M6 family metalloprotease domain-containing protein [Ignavibacteria bacterium]|nr:M6 family metalloprotease domain-containing protein [Ignavibacteria bacterium]